MQINYDYEQDRRAFAAGFWNAPDIENSEQAMDVPVIYAPYGLQPYWPDGSTPYIAPPDASIAPNSAVGITVAGSMSGVANGGNGGTPLTPNMLVAPMPSIVKPPLPQNVPTATCNISNWVSNNTGLAVLAAIAVFALTAGGHK